MSSFLLTNQMFFCYIINKEKTMADYMGFEDTLEDDDFGLIISKDGFLKGIWIPEGCGDEPVPDSIVELLQKFWGIDPNKNGETLH
jgi:hypothetical protein